MILKDFIREYGKPYSEMLCINLKSGDEIEITKWFLASLLYSKPIRENSATKTFKCFEKYEIYTPRKIIDAGWDRLVSILDEGGYTRYDFSTADKLLEVFGNLEKSYSGDLRKMYDSANNGNDLEKKLKDLGKGIGDTTVSIFLREMRILWKKADPKPSHLVRMAMNGLGIDNLKDFAKKNNIDIVSLETALLRYAKDLLKKGKSLELSF